MGTLVRNDKYKEETKHMLELVLCGRGLRPACEEAGIPYQIGRYRMVKLGLVDNEKLIELRKEVFGDRVKNWISYTLD